MLPPTTCPAAARVEGTTPERSGVICRVVERDRQLERGLDMNPVQLEIARAGGDGDVFLSIESDPQSIEHLCCGSAVPVVSDSDLPQNRASYTYCPLWQREKGRIAAGEELLFKPVEEMPTEHHDDGRMTGAPAGSSLAAADPWAQARADLDVLAPRES